MQNKKDALLGRSLAWWILLDLMLIGCLILLGDTAMQEQRPGYESIFAPADPNRPQITYITIPAGYLPEEK